MVGGCVWGGVGVSEILIASSWWEKGSAEHGLDNAGPILFGVSLLAVVSTGVCGEIGTGLVRKKA
jgi:hypothetical protein